MVCRFEVVIHQVDGSVWEAYCPTLSQLGASVSAATLGDAERQIDFVAKDILSALLDDGWTIEHLAKLGVVTEE